MSKYYRQEDVENMLKTILSEPDYQHENENWRDGICEVNSRITELNSIEVNENTVNRKEILCELYDLLDEYSELNENNLHDPKWCGVSESIGVVEQYPPITGN